MDQSGALSSFPKPGPGLKAVLGLIAVVGVLEALFVNWIGMKGILSALWCTPDGVLHAELWRLLTAGIVTDPRSIGPLFFTLIGLYFLSPDLERRWGAWRFVRFLAWSTILGYALAVAVDRLAPESIEQLHPGPMYGATAAITATAIAWSRVNAQAQVRLFFVLPMSGRALFWVTVGFCCLGVLYPDAGGSGMVAPFGGILAGMLMTGEPSPLRRAYLLIKLALLRGRARGRVPTARDIILAKQPILKKARGDRPALRVVQGGAGLEDELKKRQPSKDKRYLN